MATIYLNTGVVGGSGTVGDPYGWDALVAAIGAGDDVIVQSSVPYNVSQPLTMPENSSITIESGGTQELHRYGTWTDRTKWVEVQAVDATTPVVSPGDSNIWRNNTDTDATANVRFLRLGSLTSIENWRDPAAIEDYVPDSEGDCVQWFIDDGGWQLGGKYGSVVPDPWAPSKTGQYARCSASQYAGGGVWVYSVGNPIDVYGEIYYGTFGAAVIVARENSTIIDGLTFKYAATGVRLIRNSAGISRDLTVRNGIFSHLYAGVEIIGTLSTSAYLNHVRVHNNAFTWIDGTSVRPVDTLMNVDIYENTFDITNTVEGTANCYYGNAYILTGSTVRFRNNRCSRAYTGAYWVFDGTALAYTDQTADLAGHYGTFAVYGNYAERSRTSLRLYSGAAIRFEARHNYIVGGAQPVGIAASGGTGVKNNAHVYNNTVIVEPTPGDWADIYGTGGENTLIKLTGASFTSDVQQMVKNNILIGEDAGMIGILDQSAPDTVGGFVEDSHNVIAGCASIKIDRLSSVMTPGTGTVTVDPGTPIAPTRGGSADGAGTAIAGVTDQLDYVGLPPWPGKVDCGARWVYPAFTATRNIT